MLVGLTWSGAAVGRRGTVAPPRFARATIGELAEALGIGRNTPRAWIAEGAPGVAPYDEMAWRVWAAANAKACPAAPAPELLEQLAAAGVQPYVQQYSGGAAAPAQAAIDLGTVSIDQVPADRRKELRDLIDTQEKLIDLQKRMKALVAQADVIASVRAIARLLDQVLRELPDSAGDYTADVDEAQRLRLWLGERVKATRLAIRDRTVAELQTLTGKAVEP